MSFVSHLLLVLALLALFLDPGPRLRIPTRIRHWLRSRRTGPGASAAARARQLRTPAVRIADHFGIPTQRSREAARWHAGAAGERRTAERLRLLEREGWTVLHDRALPGSRANVDHLAISPHGRVYLPDTKRWSARRALAVNNGRLFHGTQDVTRRLSGLLHEAQAVAHLLGVPVQPLAVMDGPPLPAAGLSLNGLPVIPADQLCTRLRSLNATDRTAPHPQAELAAAAERLLPAYTQGSRP